METSEQRTVTKRRLIATALRMLVATAMLLLAYCLLPLNVHPHESIFIRLTLTLFVFIGVVAWEVRQIANHNYPKLRAVSSLAVVLPLFLFMFAWLYVNFSLADPSSFTQTLDRVSAFYFTVTVFSTVGFGDISPTTNVAQLLVTAQMLADLVLIAVGIKLILSAAERGEKKRSGDSTAVAPE